MNINSGFLLFAGTFQLEMTIGLLQTHYYEYLVLTEYLKF